MREMGVPASSVLFLDYEEINGKAMSVELTRDTAFSTQLWKIPGKFVNKLGEFDVSWMVYARDRRLEKYVERPNVMVRTTDTDLFMISILNAEAPIYPVHVEVAGTPVYPRQFFDPLLALKWLRSVAPISDDPVGEFAKAYVLSGTDFVRNGIPGVGNFTFMMKWVTMNGSQTPERVQEIALSEMMTKAAASKSRRIGRVSTLGKVSTDERAKRARYTLEYWRHSAANPEKVPDCIGWGFSKLNGRVVETESLADQSHGNRGACNNPGKRIKLMEESE